MRCTASESRRGGACSAQAFAATSGVALVDAEEGEDFSRPELLSKALWSLATGVQCSGSATLSASRRLCGCFLQ